MSGFFKIHNMKNKIISVVYTITLIITTILFILLNISTLHMRIKDYDTGCAKRVSSASNEIDRHFYQMIYMGSNISALPDIVDELKKESIGNLYDNYIYVRHIGEVLDVYKNSMAEANTITLYPVVTDVPEGIYINNVQRIQKSPEWSEVKQLDKAYKSLWYYSEETDEIALYKSIIEQNRVLAYLKISIPCSSIVSCATKMSMFDEEFIVLKDQNGNVIFQSGEKKGYSYSTSSELLNGGMLEISMPRSSVYFREKGFFVTSTVLYITLCLFLYVIYKMVIGFVTLELYDFLEQISKTDDIIKNAEMINAEGEGEIGALKRQFKALIERLLDSNRQKQQMKFDMLQSSINPHLLYNSLSALRWHMLKQKQKDIAEIIQCMAMYYRSVLSKGESIISVHKELDLAKQYVTISEFCYKRKYNYVVNINEDLLDCRVIKLLIQPFIENAIMHGISNMDDGIVTLNIEKKEDIIYIDIMDNGYGISDKTLNNIEAGIRNSNYSGYAIKNTINRIKSHYGENYGITIESKLNCGTHVRIKIPAVYE